MNTAHAKFSHKYIVKSHILGPVYYINSPKKAYVIYVMNTTIIVMVFISMLTSNC